jgi:hypothetical protein
MRGLLLVVCLVMLGPLSGFAQGYIMEGFEGPDSIPAGWGVYNNAPFPIDPVATWTVRDTGSALPGLATARGVAHSGARAIGVSWWAGIDTVTGSFLQSDVWLITPRIPNVQPGDVLKFWATGGTMSFLDSLQVYINGIDSLPDPNQYHLASLIWPVGSTYGVFQEYTYDLTIAAGLDIWIGFRYYQDIAVDGFFVHIDDVSVGPPTSVRQLPGIPAGFELRQNYPNPFNPRTTIKFALPEQTMVSLKIFNLLGEEVATLVHEELLPGSYSTEWRADEVPSGTYFYRLQSGQFVQTRKLIVLK